MNAPDPPDPIAETLAQARRLPAAAVTAVFRRYGKPLAVDLPPLARDDARADLLLDGGSTAIVRVLQIRMPVDVIANDWFVLELPGDEPLAIAGGLFAAAVAALLRRAGSSQSI